jgi:Rrf2 family protein
MHFSAQEEYGLRCVIQLARCRSGEAMTARQISDSERISLDYVHKLLGALKRKGLIESTRGIRGGFRLKRPPDEITIGEVLRLLSSRLNAGGHCARFDLNERPCPRHGNCEVKLFWERVIHFSEEYGSRITVQELIERKLPGVTTVYDTNPAG